MRNFNRLVLNEWLKITKKRSYIVPYLMVLVFALAVGYITHTFTTDMFASAADFTAEMLLPTGVGQIMAILVITGTAGIVSREYSQGTIKFLLIRARSRTAILASKYVTVLLYTLSLLLAAGAAVFISGGFSSVLAEGRPESPGFSPRCCIAPSTARCTPQLASCSGF